MISFFQDNIWDLPKSGVSWAIYQGKGPIGFFFCYPFLIPLNPNNFSASDTAVSLAIHTLVDNQSVNIGIDSSFPSRLPELTPCHINLLLLLRKQQILRDRLFFGASLLKQQLHCA